MYLDQVWSILPALELLPSSRLKQSRGGNSNAGKWIKLDLNTLYKIVVLFLWRNSSVTCEGQVDPEEYFELGYPVFYYLQCIVLYSMFQNTLSMILLFVDIRRFGRSHTVTHWTMNRVVLYYLMSWIISIKYALMKGQYAMCVLFSYSSLWTGRSGFPGCLTDSSLVTGSYCGIRLA